MIRLMCALFAAILATNAFAQSTIGFTYGGSAVDEDAGTVQFSVIRTGSLTGAARVDYETTGGDAVANVDYVPTSGTLHFGNGESSKTISLTVIDNNVTDAKRSRLVGLWLHDFVHASWNDYYFYTVEIKDDEPPPPPLTLSYGNLTFDEGDGVTNTYLTINLNRPHDQDVRASFRSWLPLGPDPYNGVRALTHGGIHFPPGQTSIQVPLEIRGNNTNDGTAAKNFYFSVMPLTAYVVAPSFEVILTEDDAQPSISISDISVPEGSCGPTPIEITLTSDAPVNSLVYWTTSDGTGTQAGLDYGPYGGPEPIYMTNTNTAKLTLIAPYGDLDIESDETFFVTLTAAKNPITGDTNASLGDATATVTIENDDEELASFLDDFVRLEAGQQTDLTIRFPAPAPAGSVLLSSSDPRVKIPASVAVPERATSVTFKADATAAAGNVIITAALPGRLGGTQLSATVEAFRDSDLRFQGPRRIAFAGETTVASITLDPAREQDVTVALTASAGIVAPESVVVPAGGTAEFPFTSLAAGPGWITAAYDEITNSLELDIARQELKSFLPDSAPTAGGTTVTLKGVGFSPGCSASFGNTPATTTFVDAQTLIAKTPTHAAESVNVTVTCGMTPATTAGKFQFANGRRRASRH